MGHLQHAGTRTMKTPREWLPLGAQIGEFTNTIAKREDIIAYVGEGAGHGAPACFLPEIAEMEVDVELAFGEGVDPRMIGDFTQRSTHFDHPVAAGATMHEGCHARWSLWSFAKLSELKDQRVAEVMVNFEEIRIERLGIEAWPDNRSFLRSCAMKLVVGDLSEIDVDKAEQYPIMAVSKLTILLLGRVDAGVLEAVDVTKVYELAEKAYGEDLLEKLQVLWTRAALDNHHHDSRYLQDLAEQWIKLLEDAKLFDKEKIPQEILDMLAEMGAIIVDMGDDAEIRAGTEAREQEAHEKNQARIREQAEKVTEQKKHEKTASKVFGIGSHVTTGKTLSEIERERPPKADERRAANQIARMLDKARYRDRVATPQASQAPPGRLRMRDAMQGHVQRARGQIVTAEPWRRVVRHQVEDPTLKLGIMTDISGSMGRAMEPMGVTSWLFSEAGRRCDATVASLCYGNSVFPVLSPGQRLPNVRIYGAHDGTEEFKDAFNAMNGKLGLLNGSGARLLVIISDMCYRAGQLEYSHQMVKRCVQAGVAVLILPCQTSMPGKASPYIKAGAELVMLKKSGQVTEMAEVIGRKAADLLERAGTRR